MTALGRWVRLCMYEHAQCPWARLAAAASAGRSGTAGSKHGQRDPTMVFVMLSCSVLAVLASVLFIQHEDGSCESAWGCDRSSPSVSWSMSAGMAPCVANEGWFPIIAR